MITYLELKIEDLTGPLWGPNRRRRIRRCTSSHHGSRSRIHAPSSSSCTFKVELKLKFRWSDTLKPCVICEDDLLDDRGLFSRVRSAVCHGEQTLELSSCSCSALSCPFDGPYIHCGVWVSCYLHMPAVNSVLIIVPNSSDGGLRRHVRIGSQSHVVKDHAKELDVLLFIAVSYCSLAANSH